MSENSAGIGVISPGYRGPERRAGVDRRQRADQRSSIRFDDKGGDRRADMGRRSTDVGLHFLD